MKPSHFEQTIEHQFDSLSKKVVNAVVMTYHRDMKTRKRFEAPFADYGFYSNRYKPTLDKIYELYGIKKKRKLKTWKQRKTIYKKKIEEFKYRYHMIQSYQRDPIKCSCGDIMKYSHTYNPFEGGKPNDRRSRRFYQKKLVIGQKKK